jgi:hypothetical protein
MHSQYSTYGFFFFFLLLSYVVRTDNVKFATNIVVDRKHLLIKAKILVVYKYYLKYGGTANSKLSLNLSLHLKILL